MITDLKSCSRSYYVDMYNKAIFNNRVLDYTFRLVTSRFHVSSIQVGKSH